jgi:hypothetical protein
MREAHDALRSEVASLKAAGDTARAALADTVETRLRAAVQAAADARDAAAKVPGLLLATAQEQARAAAAGIDKCSFLPFPADWACRHKRTMQVGYIGGFVAVVGALAFFGVRAARAAQAAQATPQVPG